METQTRYDLNAAIENWRAELAAQANLTAEIRRELETHLRDAITGFQQRGLNDEESSVSHASGWASRHSLAKNLSKLIRRRSGESGFFGWH